MTTTALPETTVGTRDAEANAPNKCQGCPRCRNANAGTCNIPHPQYRYTHPVCKVCGHCVLRGKHLDDGDDIDEVWNLRHAGNPGSGITIHLS